MTRLTWNASGERYFETGVDRGVLYPPSGVGVPWNGLVSVNEKPSGGTVKPYYQDGQKYFSYSDFEEFAATIEAYTYPEEFELCDGTIVTTNQVTGFATGLRITGQPRLPFGLSYRTRVGNDRLGADFGYKIHLVYNAMVSPAQKNYQTQGSSVDPTNFSWDITTTPTFVPNGRETSHVVIDTRLMTPENVAYIEDILYGTDGVNPRLPSFIELFTLFSGPPPVKYTNYHVNPMIQNLNGCSAASGQSTLSYVSNAAGGAARWTIESTGAIGIYLGIEAAQPGVDYRLVISARANRPLDGFMRLASNTGNGPNVIIDTEWNLFDAIITADGSSSTGDGFVLSSGAGHAAGDWIEVNSVLCVEPNYTGEVFSGSTPDTPLIDYRWLGSTNNSRSVLATWDNI